ncbi:excitatory amino acid transporter 5-like isoform X2 [Oppia nitens]|uniref:excitatory amino acid transporter 5-like isoform X2 n=1 Tax=Oppia nitens TaxID=1686743 RepID=UPI0023D9C7A3|nr:excitatory amino acid transporter 5-like isoform X2 [Oppia nitens]
MKFNSIKLWCQQNLYSILIIISAIVGLIFGFILKSTVTTISPLALTYIGLPGKLIIRAFMMIIVPLIVTSLATSITATKRGENKRLILLTFLLIVLFASSMAILGSTLVSIVRPGGAGSDGSGGGGQVFGRQSHGEETVDIKQMISSQEDSIYDIFMNLIPDNIIGATFMSHYTALVPIQPNNLTKGYRKQAERAFKPNMLGLCIFSLILGFACLHLDSRAQLVRQLLEEGNTIVMAIMMFFIKIMPIGMFFWMCAEAIKMQSPEAIIVQLGWFFGLAICAFMSVWLLIIPGLYFLVVRKNPYIFMMNIMPALVVAFGSSSSAITLPVTMDCMIGKNQLAKPVGQFVLPLGMTIHMPGSAMYYPMVTLFVAQMHGLETTMHMFITYICCNTVDGITGRTVGRLIHC